MRVEDGQLTLGDVGGTAGDTTFRDLTMTADFPQVAEDARDAYALTTGRTVDSVIALDPRALAALIGYSGPIHLPAYDVGLDKWYAAQFLLRDQYVGDFGEQGIDAIDEAIVRTLDSLLSGTLPDPTTFARDLGPLAAERRLLMWSADPDVQELLGRVGLEGSIPSLDGREGWAVTVSNEGGNKIDSFLSPALWYESSVDPANGRTSAVIRVELTNTAPASGLPPEVIGNNVGLPDGTSRLSVSAYSSLVLAAATVDGAPLGVESGTEAGWNVYSGLVDIPAGEVVTLEFQLDGVVARPGDVVSWQQPLAFDVITGEGG